MRLRGRYLLLIDLVSVTLAAVAAFVIRYEALWRVWPYIRHNAFFLVTVLLVRPTVYYVFGLYRRWWRYASVSELVTIVQAVTVGSLVITALVSGFLAPEQDGVRVFSRSILLLEWMLSLLAMGGTRILLRLVQTQVGTLERQATRRAPTRRALIMGAGDAGAHIVREMQSNPALGYVPIGFVDDASEKQGAQIYGVSVLGTRGDIPRLVRNEGIDEVVIAMPAAPGTAVREVRSICEQCDVTTKTIPGLYELLNGSVSISQIREVQIEDLLRREPVRTDLAAVERCIAGAVVLVTGAGGSIGSELCRQILARKPEQLILLGHGENSIYNIWTELRRHASKAAVLPLIADVRDAERIERLLCRHRPQVIFHAAAHKHVPLMERNAEEAFTTNALGTDNLLRAAQRADTNRFVLISSDKAVNPVSLMGASKYLAEALVQHAAKRAGRRFVVVRFGNVLGSRGSVIPLFEQQISDGGPITVTHPDMTRYFMTIPEAVQLVLQAAVLGNGGEVFVLDMGEQTRIVDLARDLISLSGLTPGEDIEIVFTGARAGERLHEELFGRGEVPIPTAHEKIVRSQVKAILSEEKLAEGLPLVLEAARHENGAALVEALQQLIPSFRAAEDLPLPLFISGIDATTSSDTRPGRAATSPTHAPV